MSMSRSALVDSRSFVPRCGILPPLDRIVVLGSYRDPGALDEFFIPARSFCWKPFRFNPVNALGFFGSPLLMKVLA